MASSRIQTSDSASTCEGKLIANNLTGTQVRLFLCLLLLQEGVTFSTEERTDLTAIVRSPKGSLSFLTWKTQNGHGIYIQRNSETENYSIILKLDKSGIFYPMIQEILKCIS
jgi:hypothetical protein